MSLTIPWADTGDRDETELLHELLFLRKLTAQEPIWIRLKVLTEIGTGKSHV